LLEGHSFDRPPLQQIAELGANVATVAHRLIEVSDVTIQQLDRKWRSLAGYERPEDVIIHDSASRGMAKIRGIVRLISRLTGRRSVSASRAQGFRLARET
jgi:hypothetical protein